MIFIRKKDDPGHPNSPLRFPDLPAPLNGVAADPRQTTTCFTLAEENPVRACLVPAMIRVGYVEEAAIKYPGPLAALH